MCVHRGLLNFRLRVARRASLREGTLEPRTKCQPCAHLGEERSGGSRRCKGLRPASLASTAGGKQCGGPMTEGPGFSHWDLGRGARV